ncbi:MAG: 3'-5' exonuclease [Cytophagaceae bacterium]|nr:3'-5' exonuclease [Cytophagaceae bacterium]MDW8456252.1 3'-5' exonuclease [Cytophagaceae bacterium]
MSLHLTKPLAFFDLETTGTNISTDRIVEIAIVKVMPSQEIIKKTQRINPTIPIPPEASMVHGIYDRDVADAPVFASVAHHLAQFLHQCDLAGFNHLRFDIPLLMKEFHMAGIEFSLHGRRLIDAQKIYHLMEPRTLAAAYKFYCGKELLDAHSAEADALATYEVLKAQIEKYSGKKIYDAKGNEIEPVKNDMDTLHKLTTDSIVDLAGRMIYNENKQEIFNFGKYKGQLVEEVLKKDQSYYDWIMKGDFPIDTKNKLTEIRLRGFNKK